MPRGTRQKVGERHEENEPVFVMEEGKAFRHVEIQTVDWLNGNRKYKRRPISNKFDQFDAMFYNALLKVDFKPPRYICKDTLEELGLFDDVKTVLEKIGLGNLPYKSYGLFPELVRQFLATVRVAYEFPEKPIASQGTLSFIIRDKFYIMTIQDLCNVFGFESTNEQIEFPKNFPGARAFWNKIGSSEYDTKGQKQSMIRNPVIRCVAKCISNTFFGKIESTGVTNDELWLLYQGTKHVLQNAYGDVEPHVNLGAVLANLFVSQKISALSSAKGVLHIGSLITPILDHHHIPQTNDPTLKGARLFHDLKYFVNCGIIKKDNIYCFFAPNGNPGFCKLPNKEITSLTSCNNLSFLLSPELSIPDPTPATSMYRLRPFPQDSTHEQQMIWIADGIQTNNDMLHLILEARNTSDGGASAGDR